MTPAHVKAIFILLTKFYYLYTAVQYQKISVHSDFEEIWQYIDNNPLQWVLDKKV